MKKDFITVNQTSGKGNGTVNVTVEPNLSFNEKQTNLVFESSKGKNQSVRVSQKKYLLISA